MSSNLANSGGSEQSPFWFNAMSHDQVCFLVRALEHEADALRERAELDPPANGSAVSDSMLEKQELYVTSPMRNYLKAALAAYCEQDIDQGFALWRQLSESESAVEAELAVDTAKYLLPAKAQGVIEALHLLTFRRSFLEGNDLVTSALGDVVPALDLPDAQEQWATQQEWGGGLTFREEQY